MSTTTRPETFTEYLLRVAQDYDNSANDGRPFGYEESPTAKDYRDAVKRITELEGALKPFMHPDLCRILTNNVESEESPVFGRNKAILRIRDFVDAREVLKNNGVPAK